MAGEGCQDVLNGWLVSLALKQVVVQDWQVVVVGEGEERRSS